MKRKRIINILLFGFGLMMVMIMSEGVYLLKRNELPKISFYLFVKRAQRLALIGDNVGAIKALEKAGGFQLLSNHFYYRNDIPAFYRTFDGNSFQNDGLSEEIVDLIKKINVNNLMQTEEYNLAKIYYDFAVLAFEWNETVLAERLFSMAVYLSPDLSHYHVELANYYLVGDRYQEAYEAIGYCMQFSYPLLYCSDYRDELMDANQVISNVGFLASELWEYYNNN